MGAADATQGRIAEIFVTAGKRTDVGRPSGTGLALRDALPGRAPAALDRPRVLIIFYVAFCMKSAQAEQNEALGMRVTSHKPSTLQTATAPLPISAGTSFPAGEEIE